MGMLLDLVQVEGYLTGFIGLNSVSANGGSTNITTPLTTALNTAGKNGVGMPLKRDGQVVAGQFTETGVVVAAGLNRVPLSATGAGEAIADGTNVVYGRVTETSGVYTVTYFKSVNGVETAHSFGSATNVNLFLPYTFDIGRLPKTALSILPMSSAGQDPNTGGGGAAFTPTTELLTIATANTLPNLSFPPVSGLPVALMVRGKHENNLGASPAFSVSGQTLTWSAVNAGYSIAPGWEVVAVYFR